MSQPEYPTVNFKGKKVLVTGGTGSIGVPLVERLVTDCQADVRVLVRSFNRASRLARFPVQMIHGDISDQEVVHQAMKGCDIVFHLAYGNRGSSSLRKRETIQGTKNVLKAALKHNIKRFVHVSTISVYGKTKDGDLDESARRQSSGEVYADSKLKAEQIAFYYFRKYGVPVTVVQPTIVYGPFVGGWTVRVINQLKRERVILPMNGNGLCNAVYIDDVIQALLLAATRDSAVGEAFLVSGEETVSWRDFYGAYEKMLGTASLLLPNPGELKVLNKGYKREHGTVHQVLGALRKPDVLYWILELPAVKGIALIIRTVIPEPQLRRFMSRIVLSDNSGGLFKPSVEKPYKPLTKLEEREFSTRTRVRIDKAKRLLEYQPRFKLEKGMKLTEMWARYANLI